jgi:hypothetical protein
LNGRDWKTVFEGAQTKEMRDLIETEVKRKIATDLVHIRDKEKLLEDFQALANETLAATGNNPRDPQYQQIAKLKPVIREMIGLQIANAAAV